MSNTYVTLEEFSEIVEFDPAKYALIAPFFLDSAVKHIENVTHRQWVADSTATARLFTGNNGQVIKIDEAVQITNVEFKYNFTDTTYTAMTANDYIAFTGSEDSPDFNSTPYTKLMINPNGDFTYWPKVSSFGSFLWDDKTIDKYPLYPSIQVTAKWGYAVSAPDVIKTAIITQATRWIKRAEGAYGDAIGNIDTGKILFVNRMDVDIKTILKDGGLIKVGIGSKK